MIPIQDVVPSTRRPVTTIALVGLNLAAFLNPFAVPDQGPSAAALSLFMHFNGAHLVFNAMFLWLFGEKVEDRLGRAALVFCYVACGAAGAITQYQLGADADAAVAASAAVAGITGAYFVVLPFSKVLMLMPIPPTLVEVPAVFFLTMFWVVQFLNFVVTGVGVGVDTSPAAPLIALGIACGCGALISAMLRRPMAW